MRDTLLCIGVAVVIAVSCAVDSSIDYKALDAKWRAQSQLQQEQREQKVAEMKAKLKAEAEQKKVAKATKVETRRVPRFWDEDEDEYIPSTGTVPGTSRTTNGTYSAPGYTSFGGGLLW